MDKQITTISLQEILLYLSKDQPKKLLLFINPTQDLETFFNYKGKIVDLSKEKLKIQMGKSTVEEVGEALRDFFITSFKHGDPFFLHLGGSDHFDIEGFFSEFSWYKSDFFKNNNFLNTDYLKKNNIVKPNEDKDKFGSVGFYKVNENSRVYWLTHAELVEIDAFLATNSKFDFECVYVN